ncbi:MAG: hypothetical protein WBD74_02815 [Candidatus Aquilonibacter sp.]
MQASDIQNLLQQNFGSKPGYDAGTAQQVATALAGAAATVSQVAGAPAKAPTPKQQQCYATCQQIRDAALAAAALKGWPLGIPLAAAAVAAFNACRHNCDQSP